MESAHHDKSTLAIVLTETHLNQNINDNEIKIDGYNLYRKDRTDRSHGGVAIYVNDNVDSQIYKSFSNKVCEFLSVKLKIHSKYIILASLYRPPDTTSHEFNEVIKFVLENHLKNDSANHEIILFGDFNFPNINWKTNSSQDTLSPSYVGAQAQKLKELSDKFYMTQFVTQPTRGSNILDLIYCNNESLIYNIDVFPTIHSDHNMINLETNIIMEEIHLNNYKEKISNPLSTVNIYSADYTKVNADLAKVNWREELINRDANESYIFIAETITAIILKYAKKKKNIKTPEHRFRRILMRRRRRIRLQLANNPRKHCLTNKLEKIELEIKNSFEKEADSEENLAISKIKTNSKYFYSYANKKLISKEKIIKIKDSDGNTITDKQKMCNILQDQFTSSFSKPTEKVHQTVTNIENNCDNFLESFSFCVDDIAAAIREIPSNSAPGNDGITPKILKDCNQNLSLPIYILWKKSLDTGIIPNACKESLIVPIHKKGKKDQSSNYRPISLTSQIVKIFEKIMKKNIVHHLETNSLLGEFQHGFREKRSCLSQLLLHYTNIFEIVNKGDMVDVIYLDFARAFDKVDHKILL